MTEEINNERQGRNKNSINIRNNSYQSARDEFAKIKKVKRKGGIQTKILEILKKRGHDKEKSVKLNYRLEKIFSEEGLTKNEYITIRKLPDKDLQIFKNLINKRISYYRNIVTNIKPTITEKDYIIKALKLLISKGSKAYKEIDSIKTDTEENQTDTEENQTDTEENQTDTEENQTDTIEKNEQTKTNETKDYSRDYIINAMKSIDYESSRKEIDIANINNGINIPEVRVLISKHYIVILLLNEQVGVIDVDDNGDYNKLRGYKDELHEAFTLLERISYFKELYQQYEEYMQSIIESLENDLGTDFKDLINYEKNRRNYGYYHGNEYYRDEYEQGEKIEDEMNEKAEKIKKLVQEKTKDLTVEDKFNILDQLIEKYIIKPGEENLLYGRYFYDLDFVKSAINKRNIKNYQNHKEKFSDAPRLKEMYEDYLKTNTHKKNHLILDTYNRMLVTHYHFKLKEDLEIITNKKNEMKWENILKTIYDMYLYQMCLSVILTPTEWKEEIKHMTEEYIQHFNEEEKRKIAKYLIKEGFGYYVYIESELFGYNNTDKNIEN